MCAGRCRSTSWPSRRLAAAGAWGSPTPGTWFVTPEPVPLAGFGSAARAAVSARLEPEGITLVGSTFADLRPGAVLLDPQGECIEVDRVVTLGESPRITMIDFDRAVRHPSAGGPAMKRSMRIVVVGGSGLIGDRS